jgi:pyruvate dehydrogenase (quinone)
MRLFWELNERLPERAILTADSGSAVNWYARDVRFRADTRGSLSGTLATMGPALPYGIGAKFAHPDRPVIAFEGDGAMQMNGLAELITVARYRERWSDQRFVVAVLHNGDLNEVTWELRALGGSPSFPASQELPDVDYAAFARGLGLAGIEVARDDDLGAAWDEALAAGRPAVLDVRTSPDFPPVPPHTTLEQVRKTAGALLKGDEHRGGVLSAGLRTKVQELLPHRDHHD